MSIDKKIEEFILKENYEQAEKIFIRQGEDDKEVKTIIAKFKANKIKAQGSDKDIAKWMKGNFEDFKTFVDKLEQTKTNREKQRNEKTDVIEVFNKGNVRIIIPKTEGSSCEYGKGTKWCTAGKVDNHFKEYLHGKGHTLYYVIVTGGIDKSLTHNDKYVLKYHGDGEKGIQHGVHGVDALLPEQKQIRELYMNVEKPVYNRLAVLVRNETHTPEAIADAKARGKVPASLTQPFDIFDNYMKRTWFQKFKELYGISDDVFSLRTKEVDGKFQLKDK